jgi:hypothetical protein
VHSGDWTVIEGAYFDCWRYEQHVVEPFEVPAHWAVSLDGLGLGQAVPDTVAVQIIPVHFAQSTAYRNTRNRGEDNAACQSSASTRAAGNRFTYAQLGSASAGRPSLDDERNAVRALPYRI